MSYDSTIDELEFFSRQPVSEATDNSALVVLIGPIRHWWGVNWNTDEHRHYVEHRDAIRLALVVVPGIAVYSPHRAIQGAWHPSLQRLNDAAVLMADVIVDLTPDWIPDLTAEGTARERTHAREIGTPIVKTLGCLYPEFVVEQVKQKLALR
jgi:hypothetical protein